jgi:hypothetical protein
MSCRDKTSHHLKLEMVFYTQKMMSRKYAHQLRLIVHESFILPSKEEGIMSREKNRKCK